MTSIEVKLAKGLKILLPLVDQICGDHDDDGTALAAHRKTVCNRQRDECLTHANLVGKDHSWLIAQPVEDSGHFRALTLLVSFWDTDIQPLSQHQFRRRIVDVP